MKGRKDLNTTVKSGAAKVYRKNLARILDAFGKTNPLIQKSQFQNYIILAEECLANLKKAEASTYTDDLENEYNYYKELYLKTVSC